MAKGLTQKEAALVDCDAIFWLPRRELVALLREAAAALPPAPNPEDVQADLDAWKKVWQGKQPPAPPVSEDEASLLIHGLEDVAAGRVKSLEQIDRERAASALPRAETPRRDETQHWAVTVYRNGENILTIESNSLSYWEAKKLALDAVRPDFTRDQLRELNAAEGRLLAAIFERLRGEASSAPASQEKQPTFGVVARSWNQVVWWQAIGGACIQRTVSFSTPDDAAKFYDALAAAAQPEGAVPPDLTTNEKQKRGGFGDGR